MTTKAGIMARLARLEKSLDKPQNIFFWEGDDDPPFDREHPVWAARIEERCAELDIPVGTVRNITIYRWLREDETVPEAY